MSDQQLVQLRTNQRAAAQRHSRCRQAQLDPLAQTARTARSAKRPSRANAKRNRRQDVKRKQRGNKRRG